MSKNSSTWLSRLTKPVDLTEGVPWRVILRYAAPIMISYLLQQIYVLADAIICGQVLSSDHVAGVNDTFALTFIVLQFAFGCTGGFSVITANCVGRSDTHGVRRSLASQIYLTVVISAVLCALSLGLLPFMLRMINVTPDNPAVYSAAYTYCFIIFLGIIAQMGYNLICGVLRAYGDSVTPLIFLVISTVLNVGLDILFLVAFRMGPAGAAIATVLAQLLSVVVCLFYTFARYRELRLTREDLVPDFSSIAAHMRQGIPLGLQFSILAIGIIVMQGAVVMFDITPGGAMVAGTPAQNGFGAATKLINFLMSLYNGLAAAILGFNAQNYGRADYGRIRRGTLQSLVIMLIIFAFCLVVGLSMTIGGAYQYIFMSAEKISPESIRFGNSYIYVDILLYFVLGFLIVVRSAVQGISRAGFILLAGISELFARILICAFMPAIVNGGPIDSGASHLAYIAVAFGDPGAWLVASIVLAVPLVRNILREKY